MKKSSTILSFYRHGEQYPVLRNQITLICLGEITLQEAIQNVEIESITGSVYCKNIDDINDWELDEAMKCMKLHSDVRNELKKMRDA